MLALQSVGIAGAVAGELACRGLTARARDGHATTLTGPPSQWPLSSAIPVSGSLAAWVWRAQGREREGSGKNTRPRKPVWRVRTAKCPSAGLSARAHGPLCGLALLAAAGHVSSPVRCVVFLFGARSRKCGGGMWRRTGGRAGDEQGTTRGRTGPTLVDGDANQSSEGRRLQASEAGCVGVKRKGPAQLAFVVCPLNVFLGRRPVGGLVA